MFLYRKNIKNYELLIKKNLVLIQIKNNLNLHKILPKTEIFLILLGELDIGGLDKWFYGN